MSREAVHTLLELAPHLDLTHLEFRVAIYLADRLNTTTGQLNPSPERMARDCGALLSAIDWPSHTGHAS